MNQRAEKNNNNLYYEDMNAINTGQTFTILEKIFRFLLYDFYLLKHNDCTYRHK